MDCRKFQEYLYPYLDREVDDGLRVEIDRHLKDCPVCSFELTKELKFGKVLKAHLIKEKASFGLCEVLAERLAGSHRRAFLQKVFVMRVAPAFALLMVAVVAYVTVRPSPKPAFPIFTEAVENHLDYLRGIYPLEFQTGSIKEALAWFRGKTDFAVTSPHIDLSKARLIGGRIVHLKDKKSAYFLLERDGYQISAFYADLHDVIKPIGSVGAGIRPMGMRLVKTEKGFHAIYCFHPEDGTACILVSDMPLDELEKLVV